MENTYILYTICYIFSKFIISDRNIVCPTFVLWLYVFSIYLYFETTRECQCLVEFMLLNPCSAMLHCHLGQKHIFRSFAFIFHNNPCILKLPKQTVGF
jgi:hypothetical protein